MAVAVVTNGRERRMDSRKVTSAGPSRHADDNDGDRLIRHHRQHCRAGAPAHRAKRGGRARRPSFGPRGTAAADRA